MTAPESSGSNGLHISRTMLMLLGILLTGMGGVATAVVWGMTLGHRQGQIDNRVSAVEKELGSRHTQVVQFIALQERVSGHSLRLDAVERSIDRLSERIWAMQLEGCKP